MRNKEIKYKAKNKKGEWVEGVYIKVNEKHFLMHTDPKNKEEILKEEVDYESVSQMLAISNGKEIYENDIVDIKNKQGDYFREGIIEFNEQVSKFCIRTTHDSLPLERYLELEWVVETKENLFDQE